MELSVIRECSALSMQGKVTFPEVVMRLAGIGVQYYFADLARLQKTYYAANGKTHIENMDFKPPKIADKFSTDEVQSAIRAIQKQEIEYPEFLHQIIESGCAFYIVFITGKKAIYFGKNGDFHVENFPSPK